MSMQSDSNECYEESARGSEDSISCAGSDYTPEWEKGDSKKGKYQIVPEQKRKRLIEFVEKKGISVSKAAKRVGIKYSTAKTIYATYLKEGRVGIKSNRSPNRKNLNKTKALLPPKKLSKEPIKSKGLPEGEKTGIFKEPTENKKAVKSRHDLRSSKVCRIKELGPPCVRIDEPVLEKRVKTEEIENKNPSVINPVLKPELNGFQMKESIQSYGSEDLLKRTALAERQILLSCLNGLVAPNSQTSLQSQFTPSLVQSMNHSNNTFGMSPYSLGVNYNGPPKTTPSSFLEQRQNAFNTQQIVANMFALNKFRVNF